MWKLRQARQHCDRHSAGCRGRCLTLGAQGIQVGDVIAMEAVDGLRFTPLAAPAGLEAQFQFTPVFSDGRSGDAVTVELYLLAEANGAPVAENLEFTTYKNVAVTAQFSPYDPRGSAHVSYPQQARPRGGDHAGGRQQRICLHPL